MNLIINQEIDFIKAILWAENIGKSNNINAKLSLSFPKSNISS